MNEKGISQIDIKIDSFYECNSINGLLLYLPFLAKKINSNSSHLITLKQNEESTIILISFTEPFVNSVIISCEADLKIQSEKTIRLRNFGTKYELLIPNTEVIANKLKLEIPPNHLLLSTINSCKISFINGYTIIYENKEIKVTSEEEFEMEKSKNNEHSISFLYPISEFDKTMGENAFSLLIALLFALFLPHSLPEKWYSGLIVVAAIILLIYSIWRLKQTIPWSTKLFEIGSGFGVLVLSIILYKFAHKKSFDFSFIKLPKLEKKSL